MTETSTPLLSNIQGDQLALVHTTNRRPSRDASGQFVVETSFEAAGGYSQEVEEGARLRQTLHFSLQSAVTDHVYGSFEGRRFFLVAPLMETLRANGRPESLLTSDVAFFPKEGRMKFPNAVLIEMDPYLVSNQFAVWENDVLRINPSITPNNVNHARQIFSEAGADGVDVSPFAAALASPDATTLSSAAIVDLALALALAKRGMPSLNTALGQSLGAPMGFDGWANTKELKSLASYIEATIPADGMGDIEIGRHSGMAGDRLFSAVSRSNLSSVRSVGDDAYASPRVREAARTWEESWFLARSRQELILGEIISGPDKLTNDNGVDRTGLTRTLFGLQKPDMFEHPKIGEIGRDEVEKALLSTNLDVVEQIQHSLKARGQARLGAGQTPHPADEYLIQWTREHCEAARPPIKDISVEIAKAWRASKQELPAGPARPPRPPAEYKLS